MNENNADSTTVQKYEIVKCHCNIYHHTIYVYRVLMVEMWCTIKFPKTLNTIIATYIYTQRYFFFVWTANVHLSFITLHTKSNFISSLSALCHSKSLFCHSYIFRSYSLRHFPLLDQLAFGLRKYLCTENETECMRVFFFLCLWRLHLLHWRILLLYCCILSSHFSD